MRLPKCTFKCRVRDDSIEGDNPYKWQDMTTEDFFKGKKVVVFALPGAFTPTCSSSHLPDFEKRYDELKALGIDEVYCLSVNDAFVMHNWAKAQGAEKVKMIPDGCGEFTRLMGMDVKKDNLGFGVRSWRYSMFIDDMEIKKIFEEPGKCDDCPTDPYECSDVHTMIEYLQNEDQAAA